MTFLFYRSLINNLSASRIYFFFFMSVFLFIFFFFFQAEDGIRDLTVTGVQTCALPISDGEPQEVPPRLPVVDADRLEPQLLEGHISELGGLAHAVENHALGAVARQVAQGLAERLTGAPIDAERVGHVLVGEPALFQQPRRGQDVS